MKRFVAAAVLIFATLTLIYVVADDAQKLDTSNLTLSNAVDYALSNNSQILLNESKIKAAKVGLEEAKDARVRAKQGKNRGDYEVEKAIEGYYVRQAEMGVKSAELILQQSREQLKAKVQTDYFMLKNAFSKLEKSQMSYMLAEKTLSMVKAKLEMGLASELELMQTETVFEKAKADRSAAVRSVDAAERTLAQTLSLQLDTVINLADDIIMLDLPEATAVSKLDEAVETRMECVLAREQAALDKLDWEIMIPWYDVGTFKYKQAEIKVQSSNLNVYKTEEQAKMNVYKAYDDMMNAYEALPVVSMAEKQAEKAYNVAIIKYESGMVTADAVLDALSKLEEAQIAYTQAVLAYNLSVITFENSYGIGI